MNLNDKAPEQGRCINKVLILTLLVLLVLVLGKAYYLILGPLTYSTLQVQGLAMLVIAELVGLVAVITNLIIKETK